MAQKNSGFISSIEYPYSKSWDKTNTNVKFEVTNINVADINGIRRCIISQTESFSFRTEPYEKNDITIIKNETALNNQIICHRIGMIPIHIPDTKFKIDDYEFIIEVENNNNYAKTITSEDFKILKISTNTYLSKEEVQKIFPKDPISKEYIIITKLKPSYNIINYKLNSYKDELLNSKGKTFHFHCKAKAVLSNGAENSRFSPVASISYNNKVDETKADIAEKDYIETEIRIAKEKQLTPRTNEQLSRYFNTTLRERYYYDNNENEPTKFIFNLESVGVVPPLILVHRGILCLIDKINNFLTNIKSLNENVINIQPSPNLIDGFQITVLEENDTLGNIIQENFYNYFCNKNNGELDYIGYKRIHPLEEKIIINIKSSVYTQKEDIITNIISIGCLKIIKKLKDLQKDLENKKEFSKELKSIQ